MTPYAATYEGGAPRWWAMCRWIWGAGASRLSHVALMRASSAARRFAGINVLLLSFAVGLIFATQRGWRIAQSPLGTSSVRDPQGKGWLEVLSGRLTSRDGIGVEVDLWWNPAQAIIAGAVGLLAALLAGWILLRLARVVIDLAHRSKYRGERRMSAALLYSTAWIVPALPAAVILALWPLAILGAAGRWSWSPSEVAIIAVAGVTAGLAAMMWWFWTIRLGATAPPDTRGRLSTTFVLILPALLIASAVGFWLGLNRLLSIIFDKLNMSF